MQWTTTTTTKHGVALLLALIIVVFEERTVLAADPPPKALKPAPAERAPPFMASTMATPTSMLCGGNVLVTAEGSDVFFYPRKGGGTAVQTSSASSSSTGIAREASILRSGPRGSELVLLAANATTNAVWLLSNGEWQTLNVPIAVGEHIADALLSKTTTYVLTDKALYIEGEPWKRVEIRDSGLKRVLLVGDQIWLLGYSEPQKRTVAMSLSGDSTLATKEFAELGPVNILDAWAGAHTIWIIAHNDDILVQLDLNSGKVTSHKPRVGALHTISGSLTANGDLVAVTGEVAAYYDAKADKFAYPTGKTSASLSCLDTVGRDLYVANTFGLERVNANHHLLDTAPPMLDLAIPKTDTRPPFYAGVEVPMVRDDNIRGPLLARSPSRFEVIPSFRLALGWGRFPAERHPDQSQFDAMLGLRFLGSKSSITESHPQFFFWPEAG